MNADEITDEEAKKAARTLMKYCEERQCENCCFCPSNECGLYDGPLGWIRYLDIL